MATPSQEASAQPPAMEESAYRRCERRYSVRRVALNAKQTKFARQDPELDDGEVLDFASPNIDADPRVRRLGPEEADMRRLLQLGHGGGGESSINVFALRDRPGVYYIPGALGARAQARWARTCLARFSMSRHTNLTNLARQSEPEGPAVSSPSPPSSLWADAVRHFKEQQNETASLDAAIKALLRPLRWANIGQNYDWGSRRYAVDVTRRPAFPEDDGADASAFHCIPPSLRALVHAAVAPLGLSCEAEAGIVNFYPSDASMGGHVDDAEGALAHPVVSFSLGLAAIFLLGGATKDSDTPVIPILVRSGDCLVMGGASRLCVHGVPAILTDSARSPALLTDGAALLASRFWEDGDREDGKGEPCSEAEAMLLARYMATSRVNFNLRQVWPSEGEEEEEKEAA